MTTQLTKKQQQIADLKEFAQELKDNGFTVLVSKKHEFEWLYFFKNGQFGVVNASHFFNYNFGTVHKPCRECGTGFGITQEDNLSIENANKSLVNAPQWAKRSQLNAIRKYTSIEDFINSIHNEWAEYYIL